MNPVFEGFLSTGNANILNSFGQKYGRANDVCGMNVAELARLQKYDQALAAINKGIEKNTGYDENIYNRACIY